jgi:hypothetical protein
MRHKNEHFKIDFEQLESAKEGPSTVESAESLMRQHNKLIFRMLSHRSTRQLVKHNDFHFQAYVFELFVDQCGKYGAEAFGFKNSCFAVILLGIRPHNPMFKAINQAMQKRFIIDAMRLPSKDFIEIFRTVARFQQTRNVKSTNDQNFNSIACKRLDCIYE